MAAERFGIGEWYGKSFFDMTPEERRTFAEFKTVGGTRLQKAQRDKLSLLLRKERAGEALTGREQISLETLKRKREEEVSKNQLCPFRVDSVGARPCNKDGGVCSFRLYGQENGKLSPVTGARDGLRAMCPNRFYEGGEILRWVGEVILGNSEPVVVGEVGFLESEETLDGTENADVGRIDMVLVNPAIPKDYPLNWAALEVQAVYFSGKEMGKEFRAISESVVAGGQGLIWPTETRRPDYRSSGPKRLMPQLQIKVPTLRRWGKKMAVVVDRSFFESMGKMDEVDNLSNADIAWFLVDFERTSKKELFSLKRHRVVFTTLEEAVNGLTGGNAVSQQEFESRIREKLGG